MTNDVKDFNDRKTTDKSNNKELYRYIYKIYIELLIYIYKDHPKK